MHTDRCGHTSGWECHAKVSRKEAKIQESVYRNTMNVESEINGQASDNQSHRHSNRMFKEKFGSHTRKTFNRFAIKDM